MDAKASPRVMGSHGGDMMRPNSMHYKEFRTRVIESLQTHNFQRAFSVSFSAGLLAIILKLTDSPDYFLKLNYLADILPDTIVLNCFIVFVSFITAMRATYALTRFTDASMYLHQLNASWFDSASTLFAFCRASKADADTIDHFQQTLVRLISLLNALCLQELQEKHEDAEDGKEKDFNFSLIDLESIDPGTQKFIRESDCKVEVVFQGIQQLVVDNIQTGVLCIAPPILSRSFQELGTGLMKYHEAMKLVKERTPFAFSLLTHIMLVSMAVFGPIMLSASTKGLASSFFLTSFGTFLLWYLNLVAESLDNPFHARSNTLDAGLAQWELNQQLLSLIKQSTTPTPSVIIMPKLPSSGTSSMGDMYNSLDSVNSGRLVPEAGAGSMRSGKEGGAASPVGKRFEDMTWSERITHSHSKGQVTAATKVNVPSQRRNSRLCGKPSFEGPTESSIKSLEKLAQHKQDSGSPGRREPNPPHPAAVVARQPAHDPVSTLADEGGLSGASSSSGSMFREDSSQGLEKMDDDRPCSATSPSSEKFKRGSDRSITSPSSEKAKRGSDLAAYVNSSGSIRTTAQGDGQNLLNSTVTSVPGSLGEEWV